MSMDKEKIEALQELFIASRTILELSETIGNEQLIVDGENMDDLEMAYQKVVSVFGVTGPAKI